MQLHSEQESICKVISGKAYLYPLEKTVLTEAVDFNLKYLTHQLNSPDGQKAPDWMKRIVQESITTIQSVKSRLEAMPVVPE